MTDHDALMHAIGANPEDDLARFVFADWLEENGQPDRARFIRADVAADRLGKFDPVRLRWELVEKPVWECELRSRAGLPALPEGWSWLRRPLYRRGFPWGVSATSATRFTRRARLVCAAAPVKAISLAAMTGPLVGRLWRTPALGGVTALAVSGDRLTAAVVEELAAAPHAVGLKELDVSTGRLTAAAGTALARSPLFPRLSGLKFGNGDGIRAWGEEIDRARAPVRLKRLEVCQNGLDNCQIDKICRIAQFSSLEVLQLSGCRLELPGYQVLVRTAPDSLREIDLGWTCPGVTGTRLLSTSVLMSRLNRLAYRANNLNDVLVRELAASFALTQLRVLDLGGNPIGPAGAAALAAAPHLTGLLVLDLSQCQVGDAGAAALLASPLADRLVFLNLAGSKLSGEMKQVVKGRLGDRVGI